MFMSGILKKIRAAFREFGLFAGALYLVDQALSTSNSRVQLRFYDIMVQPISQTPLAPKNLTKSFEVREIIAGSEELRQFPRPTEIIEQRFEQGAVCLGGYDKGKLVGFLWLKFGEYYEDEVRCVFVTKPASETVFDFDIYLFPDHRFGIGFIGLWDGTNEYLHRNGIRYTCSRVSRFNVGSRKSHEHLGWKRLGRTLFLCGRSNQLMLGTLKPYVHFQRANGRRPRICIDTARYRADD